MTYFGHDWRHRRHLLNPGGSFGTMHHNIANYSTDTKKPEIEVFEDTMFTKIQSIPDPLKKNLADSVITHNSKQKVPYSPTVDKEFYYEANIGPVMSETVVGPSNSLRRNVYSPFTGITSFISNVFGSISEVMFQRKSRSPVSQYYDCYESDSQLAQEMAAESWQAASFDDQNKKTSQEQCSRVNDDMNNCRAAVAQVEDKISAVRDLLTNKTVPNVTKSTRVRYRRPRRAFVEAGSVSDSYEEDITSDSYVSLPNDDYIEYVAVPNNQIPQICNIEAERMKTELGIVPESTDSVKILPDDNVTQKAEIPTVIDSEVLEDETKKEVIASCEDKLAKLKAMLLERKKPIRPKPTDDTVSDPEPVKEDVQKPVPKTKVIPIQKTHDKRFKNPCRLTSKRRKSNQRKNIHSDMVFANEIDSDEVSSLENSPAVNNSMQRLREKLSAASTQKDKDYFDETKGRFHSASTDSDDSFQIVFSESPKLSRMRRPSECDSEDSFIVFEESPNSCFTSNHLFEDQSSGYDDSDSEISDEESDVNDSGCLDVCKLSHSLSRTVSDLSDNSLFDDSKPLEKTSVVEELNKDEVDCAVRSVDSVVSKELSPVKEESPEIESDSEDVDSGLLLTEAKKLKRRGQPRKSVSFSEKPPKVHVMRVWDFAARQARAGHWERFSLDRERFKRRIADVDMAISWVLKPQHRSRIMFQRFMPWWNKQKRIEAAEKKLREQEERLRKEEERIKKEREGFIEEELNREIDEINKYYDDLIDHINAIIKAEKTEKKLRAIQELKDALTKDKKKLAKRKEREKKMESELSKPPISVGGKLPNGILPLC